MMAIKQFIRMQAFMSDYWSQAPETGRNALYQIYNQVEIKLVPDYQANQVSIDAIEAQTSQKMSQALTWISNLADKHKIKISRVRGTYGRRKQQQRRDRQWTQLSF
mgnify:FL=1